MPSSYRKNICPPTDDVYFESLCLALCQREFKDPLVRRVGRNGQSQDGIDIRGTDRRYNKQNEYAVQCKVINDQPRPEKFMKIISSDLEKLKESNVSYVIFAVTIKRDKNIQDKIDMESIESKNKGGPEIAVWSWDDIIEKMNHHSDILHMLDSPSDVKGIWIENLFDSWRNIVEPDSLYDCIRYERFILIRHSLFNSLCRLDFLVKNYRSTLPENNNAREIFHEIEVYYKIIDDLYSFIIKTKGEVPECDREYFDNKEDIGFYGYYINLNGMGGYSNYIYMMNQIVDNMYYFIIRQCNKIISLFNIFNSHGLDVSFSKARYSDYHNSMTSMKFIYIQLCYDEAVCKYPGLEDLVCEIKGRYDLKDHEIPNIQ